LPIGGEGSDAELADGDGRNGKVVVVDQVFDPGAGAFVIEQELTALFDRVESAKLRETSWQTRQVRDRIPDRDGGRLRPARIARPGAAQPERLPRPRSSSFTANRRILEIIGAQHLLEDPPRPHGGPRRTRGRARRSSR